MPLKPLPARVIVKKLQKLGFQKVSQKGSHLKLRKTIKEKTYNVIVPMHNKDIAISVIGRILEQGNIKWEDIESVK